MKLKMKMGIAIAAVAILTGQTVVQAGEAEKPTAGIDLGFFSQYIWRGYALSKDSLVIQPSVTVGYKGVSLNVWGNLDTDNYVADQSQYNETDVTLSCTKSLGMVNLTGGYIYYGLESVTDSQELYASVGLNTILKPTITIYREVASTPAWYVNVGVSHSLEVVNEITFDMAASAAYYFSDDNSFHEADNVNSKYRELHNGLLSAGFTIPFLEYFSVKPLLAYSFPLSSKAKDFLEAANQDAGYGKDASFVYGGVTLSMAF